MRKPLDLFAVLTLSLLCLIWGFQQIALKLAADEISPIMQIGIRCAFAATVLLPFILYREGRNAFKDGTLVPGLVAGAMFASEFLLIGEGLERTSAAHMVVFLYTAPLFTALGMHFVHDTERLSSRQWFGLVVAFTGVAAVFVLPDSTQGFSLEGDLLALAAGAVWGFTTVMVRGSRLTDASATKTLFYQLGVAGVVMPLIAVLMGKSDVVLIGFTLANLIFQCIVVALFSYLTWFWLLRHYLASRLATFSFMTPLFGVSFGVIILDEAITPVFIFGALAVVMGILMVSWRDKPKGVRLAK